MEQFKVGDRVRHIVDGDIGDIFKEEGGSWWWVSFEQDGDCLIQGEDIEILASEAVGISSFEQSVRRHTDRIANLLIEKNKAYGDSALNPVRIFSKADRTEGLYQRIDDKLSRVARGGDYPGDDTVLDLIGYLCLLMIARESE